MIYTKSSPGKPQLKVSLGRETSDPEGQRDRLSEQNYGVPFARRLRGQWKEAGQVGALGPDA